MSDDVISIGDVVRLTGAVIVVLDPWDKPVCLTRAWCLFEMLHCELHQRQLTATHAHAGTSRGRQMLMHLALAPSEQRGLARAMHANTLQVEKALVNFDSRNASASLAKDRRMIFEMIEREFRGECDAADAHKAFNSVVRAAVQRALAAYSWGLTEPADRSGSHR